jgi:hypothetical protein
MEAAPRPESWVNVANKIFRPGGTEGNPPIQNAEIPVGQVQHAEIPVGQGFSPDIKPPIKSRASAPEECFAAPFPHSPDSSYTA